MSLYWKISLSLAALLVLSMWFAISNSTGVPAATMVAPFASLLVLVPAGIIDLIRRAFRPRKAVD